jgi:Tfp pilus assembly protein PilF
VLTTLGWVRHRRGESAQAEAALARAVALQPNADRLTRLAMVRAAMGQRAAALADLRRALEMQPGYARARQELERIQRN